MERYYTPEQIADLLTVQKQTVYAWLRSGKLSGVNRSEVWQVSEANFHAFLIHHISARPFKEITPEDAERMLEEARKIFMQSITPERQAFYDSLPYDDEY